MEGLAIGKEEHPGPHPHDRGMCGKQRWSCAGPGSAFRSQDSRRRDPDRDGDILEPQTCSQPRLSKFFAGS